MEKIISINLGGRVISIEDTAYTSLKAYLETLHRYFDGEEGRDEIINDIESRVAELLEEKMKRGSAAITEADVQEVMGSIGRVEDFAAEEGADAEPGPRGSTARKPGSKRFYRDENDKIAGGVCSGLAAYLNVDPALVRVVFAILAFGGWGTGVLLYIVLWIFVPTMPMEGFRGRRLFRSEEEKWFGGVCSGLAAYFNKEAWMFRLAFVSPIILSAISDGAWNLFPFGSLFFGSITGTFILIYIVLWVVLPVARSPFEKMEMRGEKVDLDSIRQNVYAEMGGVKERVKNWSGEVKDSASQFMNTRGKEFGREVSNAARPIASRGGEVIVTIIKAFFYFIATTLAFALFITLIGYSFGGFAGLVNGFILRTAEMRTLGWATVILCLGVPLIALVTMITRRALKMRGGSRYLGVGFSLLWVAGIVCAGILASSLVAEFQRDERVSEEVPLTQPVGGKLTLMVTEPAIEYSNSLPWLRGDIHGWDVSGDSMRIADVELTATKSPDSLYHVILTKYSGGRNAEEARERAGQINYATHNLFGADSVLQLGNGYVVTKRQGYRGQSVQVEVQVPAGKVLRFDETVLDRLPDVNRGHDRHYRKEYSYRHGYRVRWHREDRWWDEWKPNVDYVMGVNGELVDPLHPGDKVKHDDEDDLREAEREIHKADSAIRNENDEEVRMERRVDSLDRAINAIEREKERLEGQRERRR
jgi:phage shock protein PspC (stress-responsive transcriptional regulator)